MTQRSAARVARLHPDIIGDIFFPSLDVKLGTSDEDYESFAKLVEASLHWGRMSYNADGIMASMTYEDFDLIVDSSIARCKAGRAIWNLRAVQEHLRKSTTEERVITMLNMYIAIANDDLYHDPKNGDLAFGKETLNNFSL